MDQNRLIIQGFASLCAESRASALATIVRVVGSSYRRPGARMLVSADGRSWGGVSGGCLEHDVIRQARLVIDSGRAITCRYDTGDEAAESGTPAALGCAGVIDLLIEPLSEVNPGPLPALQRAILERKSARIATLIRSASGAPPGQHVLEEDAPAPIRAALETSPPGVAAMREIAGDEYFIETLRPPQALVIFGGGHDVTPVVALANTLGWHVTVVVSHGTIGYRQRFNAADRLAVASADDPLGGVSIAPDAAVVLMTHDYPRDLQLLPRVIAASPRYIGVLGPRRRAERLVLESPALSADAIERLYAPVGLDLGADTPETIALSIVAEIQAVLAGRPCVSLRDRPGPIYARAMADEPSTYQPVTCPMSA